MSQRAFSAILVFLMFILVGLYAYSQHVLPPLHDLASNLLTFVTPLVGVFVTLNAWFDTVDNMVSDGSLKPGDIVALFTLSPFWVTMVACLSGVFQGFGLKIIDADTQAIVVNGLLVVATVLLRSFSDRTPTSAVGNKPAVVTAKAEVDIA